MDSREAQITDYRARLTHDITVTLRQYGIRPDGLDDSMFHDLVTSLVEDAMHHVEHLVLRLTT